MQGTANAASCPVTDDTIRGLWRRAYIKSPAETPDFEDHETHVYWFQANGLYADLRIPEGFSKGISAACLAELPQEDLLALSACEGFAGWAAVEDGICTWQRAINLQGPESGRDIGRLERTPGGLFEYGVDADFVELWLEQQVGDRAPEGRVFTCDGGFWGFLISSPTRFLFACDRPTRKNLALPWKDALAQALTPTDRNQLADLFLAEYSFGRIEHDTAVIELSSHPNRVGKVLCDTLSAASGHLVTHHASFDGAALTRHWTVAKLNASR